MIEKIKLIAYCILSSCKRDGYCIAPNSEAEQFFNNERICPYLGFQKIEEAE
jgi:hypothetical protein